MKILLTGSSGWLGRHLYPLLANRGYQPVGLDIAPGRFADSVASIADRERVFELFHAHQFIGVIHAAALHKPDIARYPPKAFIDVNLNGTLNLLEAAVQTGVKRFVFTSSTSLMVSQRLRDECFPEAVWLDEDTGPLEPRNIYGVTKLAAEGLCRTLAIEHRLPAVVLRTSRFFPEEDDTLKTLSGPNLKANELLHRRASVGDIARAHLSALEHASPRPFRLFLVSAPTPFSRNQARQLKEDAASLVSDLFPNAPAAYAKAGWSLPESIGRVYDGSRITRELGFSYRTAFADVLTALENDRELPFVHDPSYVSPAWARTGPPAGPVHPA